ncbi:MAG TPA: VapC toxin family PIN domain ribonuclease [Alphaproteobacteria bacterium]|nr:VapC toxin family PIN domain ribonuclease [Alphaproteobacteria bacterium]
MKFLLDTNVVSELRRPERANPNVRSWAESLGSDDYALSVITVQELERGTLLMERRDPFQGAILRRWLENEVLPRASDRIFNVDVIIARRCARLHVPDPRPERDALIAATALEHGLTLVTRDTRDFVAMGVPVLDPWAGR